MKIIAAIAVSLTASTVFAQFQTVDFSSQFNMGRDSAYLANGGTFPTGNQTYLGVPFAMGAGGDASTPWAWNALFAEGDSPHVLAVPTNVSGAVAVHTLINTFWGMPGGEGSFLSITFNATGGLSYTVPLYGDSDVRDYNQNFWTNSVNGTTTQNAWNNGDLGQRLDMQTFVLPAEFANQTLTSVELSDSGGYAFQTAFIAGLTVQTPTPGAAAVLGLGGLGAMRRRRR